MSARRAKTLPHKSDLPRRYTAEVEVRWRVWDALTESYIDPEPGLLPDLDAAEAFADAMEASR